jgi:hypothetical protein
MKDKHLRKVIEFEKTMMKKYGWYVHFVINDESTPFGINYHTHGLTETYNHKDIQICFPLNQRIVHGILINIVDEIKDGKTFISGMKYDNIVEGYNVEFIEAIEGNRRVLRCIIPDSDGEYKGEYQKQFN